MKILLQYLKPYRGLIILALFLAAVNQTFSLFDPLIFGKLIDHFANSPHTNADGSIRSENEFISGVVGYLFLLVGTAMVSRIAKAFQDYVVNVVIQKFGAKSSGGSKS